MNTARLIKGVTMVLLFGGGVSFACPEYCLAAEVACSAAPIDQENDVASCEGILNGNAAFPAGSAKILAGTVAALDALAMQMSYSPACKVVVLGNGGGSKVEQQLSWDRVNAVIVYMSEKNNIDRNRFIFVLDGHSGIDNVIFRAAAEGEDGPGTIPRPIP